MYRITVVIKDGREHRDYHVDLSVGLPLAQAYLTRIKKVGFVAEGKRFFPDQIETVTLYARDEDEVDTGRGPRDQDVDSEGRDPEGRDSTDVQCEPGDGSGHSLGEDSPKHQTGDGDQGGESEGPTGRECPGHR